MYFPATQKDESALHFHKHDAGSTNSSTWTRKKTVYFDECVKAKEACLCSDITKDAACFFLYGPLYYTQSFSL